MQGFLSHVYAEIPYQLLSGRAFPPLSVALNLTYRCNLRCEMCYHHRPQIYKQVNRNLSKLYDKELTLDEIKVLIKDAAAMRTKVFALHGGEPMLRADFFEIAEQIKSHSMIVSMITNGTFITEENAKRVHSLVDDLGISIYGPEAIHDRVCMIEGAFQKAKLGIERLLSSGRKMGKGDKLLSVFILILPANQDHLEETFDMVTSWGINRIGFGNLVFTDDNAVERTRQILEADQQVPLLGSASLPADCLDIDGEVVAEQLKAIESKAKAKGITVNLTMLRNAEDISRYHNDFSFKLATHCHYPWQVMVISPYGDVYPCIPLGFLGISLGNIRESSIREVWNSPAYCSLRRKLKKAKLFPLCNKCCMIR